MFFECDFARAVWFSATMPLRTDRLTPEPDACTLSFILTNNFSDDILQEIFTRLWYLWKARNDFRFNKKWSVSRLNHEVQADIATSILYTSHASSNRNMTSLSSAPTNVNGSTFPVVVPSLLLMQDLSNCQYWQSFVFAYADATLQPDGQGSSSRIAGLGVLVDLRSTSISCCLQVLGSVRVDSVVMAGLAALLLAAKFLSVLQIQSEGIGSDCLQAVRLLHMAPLDSPWKLHPWISHFQDLGSRDALQVTKISRAQNEAAHQLAVRARNVFFS